MVGTTVDFDTMLDLCRDQHRRIVLAVLADQQRPLTKRDLTSAIVTHNHHSSMTEITAEQHTEIECSLYHVHLPKLDAAGLVHYDRERGIVEPTEQFEEVQSRLLTVVEADPALEPPIGL